MRLKLSLIAVALTIALPLSAQTITTTGTLRRPSPASTEAPAQTQVQPAPVANAVLRAGTPVTLRLLEEVTTKEKRVRVGQRIRMEVVSPVEYDGIVVIPAGSPAEAEITHVRNKGMWGKSGRLEARALWARVNGRQIRLSGTFDDKGVTGTAGVVASIALVPIAGFLVTGTSAVLPAGGQVAAFLDQDVELAIRNPPSRVIEVDAASAPFELEGTPEAAIN